MTFKFSQRNVFSQVSAQDRKLNTPYDMNGKGFKIRIEYFNPEEKDGTIIVRLKGYIFSKNNKFNFQGAATQTGNDAFFKGTNEFVMTFEEANDKAGRVILNTTPYMERIIQEIPYNAIKTELGKESQYVKDKRQEELSQKREETRKEEKIKSLKGKPIQFNSRLLYEENYNNFKEKREDILKKDPTYDLIKRNYGMIVNVNEKENKIEVVLNNRDKDRIIIPLSGNYFKEGAEERETGEEKTQKLISVINDLKKDIKEGRNVSQSVKDYYNRLIENNKELGLEKIK
jgi:hypothetical protein